MAPSVDIIDHVIMGCILWDVLRSGDKRIRRWPLVSAGYEDAREGPGISCRVEE